MLRFGKITGIQADKGLFQVTFDDDKLVSGWIPGGVSNSKDNQDECPFAKDEHVACIMDANMEYGVVLCAIYDKKNLPPNGQDNVRSTKYKDGSFKKVNTQNGHAEVQFQQLDFNGGENGGMAKVIELTQKLNAIETLLNSFIALYNAHTHPYVNVASAAVTSPTASLENSTLTQTQREEIEDTKIKH